MKSHVPKFMLVLALAALVVAIATPVLNNAPKYEVKADFKSGAAFSVDLGPSPGSLLAANPLQPDQLAQPADHRSFLIRLQKVKAAYKPIGLTIPDLELEPIDYFVMSYLPPPPPPPRLTNETHYIDVPAGTEWAELVTRGGARYRGDIVEETGDLVKFRWREKDGRPTNQPHLDTFPKSEVSKLTPAIKADKVFAEQIALCKNNAWKVAEVCCEALDRFGEMLKDEVIKVVQSGGMGGGADSPKATLAVALHPVLFSTATPDKIASYLANAEKALAGKNDAASLKILAFLRMQVNKFGEARTALELAAANAPNDPSILQMLAYSQLKTLDAPSALKTYERLTTNDIGGTDYVARIGRAMAQARNNDLEGAANSIAAIKPDIQQFAERSMQALAGVEVAIGLGKLDDAEKALQNDVKEDTTASRREMLLGIIALKKEDSAEALKHFTAGTDAKLVRTEAWAWFLCGIVSEKSDAAGAKAKLLEAEKMAPFDPLIKMKLGDLAEANKDHVTAEKFYRQAVELDPRDHRAWKRWIQALPQDKKIGTVNSWIELLKGTGASGAVVLQAQAVLSIFQLTGGQDAAARESADSVLSQQPDNVAALITTAVLADRGADDTGAKRALETILAKTRSATLNDWALKALNQIYLQAGEHLDYFNLRTENADLIKWGKTYGARSGIVREYKEDGLTVSGTPPDAKNTLMKFGFKVNGKDFIRARLSLTTYTGVAEAGIWAGRDSTTTGNFNMPTLQVGVANGQLESLMYRKADSQWQAIPFEEVKALKAGKDSFDGITLTYSIELVDPVRGIFAVSINGQDAGNTSAAPLDPEFKLMTTAMAAGGFVRGNAALPCRVRFENLIIVSRAGDAADGSTPDAGLVKGSGAAVPPVPAP